MTHQEQRIARLRSVTSERERVANVTNISQIPRLIDAVEMLTKVMWNLNNADSPYRDPWHEEHDASRNYAHINAVLRDIAGNEFVDHMIETGEIDYALIPQRGREISRCRYCGFIPEGCICND